MSRDFQRWADVLPTSMALLQAEWVRRHQMRRAWDLGEDIEFIAHYGCTTPRAAKEMILRAIKEHQNGALSPMEYYLRYRPSIVAGEAGIEWLKQALNLQVEHDDDEDDTCQLT